MAQSPPFSINENVPADDEIVRLFPAKERLFRDIVESWLIMEHDATTGRHSIPTDTTANLAALSYPTNGALVVDTTLGQLKARVAGAFVNVGPEFPAGMRLLCGNTGAPTGWTKETNSAFNDATIRVTTGDGGATGGSLAFTDTFDGARELTGAVLGHTLTAAEMPVHTHSVIKSASVSGTLAPTSGTSVARIGNNSPGGDADSEYALVSDGAAGADIGISSSAGSGGSHEHTLSMDGLNMDVKFTDAIWIEKD